MAPNIHFTTYGQPDRCLVAQPRSDTTQNKNFKKSGIPVTPRPTFTFSLLSFTLTLLPHYFGFSGYATSAHLPTRLITLPPSRYRYTTRDPPTVTCLSVVWSQQFCSTPPVNTVTVLSVDMSKDTACLKLRWCPPQLHVPTAECDLLACGLRSFYW